MTTIPKPKHCEQNWLKMTPNNGGRICGQCDKKNIDFSKMSWTQIEKIQRQNNNSACGMYNPRQLENWGRETPNYGNSLIKSLAISGLTISFATSSYGQTAQSADSIIIKGKIVDETTSKELPGAVVLLKNNNTISLTDIKGNFKLTLKNPSSALDTLEVNHKGYRKKQIIFDDIKKMDNSENQIKP